MHACMRKRPDSFAAVHTFDQLAENDGGWIVVYPAGLADGAQGTGWNCGTAGDNSTCSPDTQNSDCYKSCQALQLCGRCDWSTCYDDVVFVEQQLQQLMAEFQGVTRTSAIFLYGESNGGMLTHHLIQQLPGRFLAAVPAFGLPLLGYLVGFDLVRNASAAQSTSILQLHGRSDPVVPWQGGRDSDNGWLYESGEHTLGIWAALHGCSRNTAHVPTQFDGERNISCQAYHACSEGRVQYCLYDGGHGYMFRATGSNDWFFFKDASLRSARHATRWI